MENKKKIICALIIGRKGSIGFPKKNLYHLLGRPMVMYPKLAAKKSKMRSIAVTTSFSYEELSGISDRVVDVISLQTLGSSLNLKEWFLSL